MPSLHEHMLFDLHYYGAEYGSTEYVHRMLDHPWVEIFGPKHRKLMHDENAVRWIEANYGPFAGLVAKSHIALDIIWSLSKRGDK